MRVIQLCAGAGNGVDTACLMTATNMLIGKPEKLDVNECVCPLLRSFIIPTNDMMPDHRRNELYGPLVWEILGTANPVAIPERFAAFRRWGKRWGIISPIVGSLESRVNHIAQRFSLDIQVWSECPKIIRHVASIGDKRPVETVLTHDQLCEALG